MPVNLGIDGYRRSKAKDEELSQTVAALFKTDSGQLVLKYLRSITIEMVHGGNVESSELFHMEGQRYIVGLLERRIEHSKRSK